MPYPVGQNTLNGGCFGFRDGCRMIFHADGESRFSARGRGRTGIDLVDALRVACRGWFVGLVNHRTKK